MFRFKLRSLFLLLCLLPAAVGPAAAAGQSDPAANRGEPMVARCSPKS